METSPQQTPGLYSGKRTPDVLLLLLTGAAFSICWVLAYPFLPAITWAFALAVMAHPLQVWLESKFNSNLAASISLVAIVIILLTPGVFVIQKLLEESKGLARLSADILNSAQIHEAAEKSPTLKNLLHWLEENFDLNKDLGAIVGTLAGQASALLGGSIRFVTQFALMLVTLFYFLRDRGALRNYVRLLLPLSPLETQELFDRVSATVHATLYGNLVVKMVQGLLGGGMFWALGLSAPFLAGLAMALFAMLPIVGTSLIWGPAVIALLMQGSYVKAIVLTLWGSLIISLLDNLLYPMLVGSELKLHTLGILFSVLGGLVIFGLAGIVVGPVILATTVALFDVWRLRTSLQHASHGHQ